MTLSWTPGVKELISLFESTYLRMDQVKFVEGSL